VAQVVKQQAVVAALEPEPSWRQLRTYATLVTAGVVFSPVSQAVLIASTSVASCAPGLAPGTSGTFRWWLPFPWWRCFFSTLVSLRHPADLRRFSRFAFFQVLHDVATRGRTQWVEQAREIGAFRPAGSLWKNVAVEAACGALGNRMMLEYLRSAVGGSGRATWRSLAVGSLAGAARGVLVASGGQCPRLMTACSWADYLLELASEQEAACLLGHQCHFLRYLAAVSCGIVSLLPWGLLIFPCNWLVLRLFGEDPLVEQKAVLERVAAELAGSLRGREALASGRQRAGDFFGRVELASLWRRVKITRDACDVIRSASLREEASAQQALADVLEHVALARLPELRERLIPHGTRLNAARALEILESSMVPIAVRRHGDLVRAALTQLADRSLGDLLMGITAQKVPGLQGQILGMLGLRAEFLGEDGIDAGGVRRDFMDCFASALVRPEPVSPSLSLVDPLQLLGLGADSTWRPVPCDEESRGFLWALGRLLALALVYRCPCPVPLSLLVFKCILGTPLRPGDVRQLDPDFWRHRVQPLLPAGGAVKRQEELRGWGMDAMTFTSVDGCRELCPDGASKLVTESNKAEYAQLLCEDFLIGQVRAEFGCLVTGFWEVVPKELMQELDAEQLRMLVCGVAELDVDEWQQHAQVEGSEEVAGWFFDWLRKRPQEARSKLLAFTTGSSVLPCGWEGLKDQLGNDLPFRVDVNGDAEALPTAHTCANLLVLPQVSQRRQLERKLDQVVELAGREMLIL